ncbi:MAG TPA: acireductone synthase [Thermoanaerobaculia bacterium]|jgi:enolase-phosphatase E1|nr:acireductone synthase [Thermoanaerobaculia bacterium]
MRAVLTDIEGTTTPLSFVHDVLFPYARRRLDAACASGEERFAGALQRLREEYDEEKRSGADLPAFGDGASYAHYLMDRDRKSTGLKMLQGILWEDGYRSGELRGQVWPDVADALRLWKERGIRVRIFSSGSVLAQKLLFGHSDQGDLLPYFEGFHDTTTGPKQDRGSYTAIAAACDLPSGEILFLSDVTAELDAAHEAGMRTGLLVRPGNKPAEPKGHAVYRSFAELG